VIIFAIDNIFGLADFDKGAGGVEEVALRTPWDFLHTTILSYKILKNCLWNSDKKSCISIMFTLHRGIKEVRVLPAND
jgi:hypothetical protein